MTLYSPNISPLPGNVKLMHDFNDEPVIEKGHFAQEGALKNDSFATIPSDTSSLVQILDPEQNIPKVFPRQKIVERLKSAETKSNDHPIPKTKIRKKVKFRLIPTFKNLERGRFVGRKHEIKEIRNMFLDSCPLNEPNACFDLNEQDCEDVNRLSVLALNGESGVGKSSLAYVYLMAFERKYKYVLWINANNILSDARDILLYHLKNKYEVQSIKKEVSAEVIRVRFLHFLSHLESNWLLVIDEFNDPSVKIHQWIPTRLQTLPFDSKHKAQVGNILITTNLTYQVVERNCDFKTEIMNLELKKLKPKEAFQLVKNSAKLGQKLTERDEVALLTLLGEKYLNYLPLPIALISNLAKTSNYSWRTLFMKYKDEEDEVKQIRRKKLKKIFKRLKESEKKKKKSKFQFSREYIIKLFTKKKKCKLSYLLDLDGFNSDLFEIELVLRKFKLLKYFNSLVDNNILNLRQMASSNLDNVSSFYWRGLQYTIGKKRKKNVHSFNKKDEVKFFEMTRFIKQQLSQQKVDICLKIWFEILSLPESSYKEVMNRKALEILRQVSWLSEHRIPMFLFPELLLGKAEERDFSTENSNDSSESNSTITNSSSALSSLNLNVYVDTKINGSARFNSSELKHFEEQKGLLTFFVTNSLFKLEKTGFFSCNTLVKKAIMNLEARTERSFDSVVALLRKIHVIGFEFNFEEIVGESLELLRTNSKLVGNNYTKVDVKCIESLSDVELQKSCSHDFNLKLNLLPHLEYIRRYAFRELMSNNKLASRYNEKRTAPRIDLFGIRHKQVHNFNKYLRIVSHSQSSPFFNASRASLFPEFSSRDLTLVKADIIFNEGLFILCIPFRRTRMQDAYNCFKTAYELYEQGLAKKRDSSGKDLTMAKCCAQMANCKYKLGYYEESLFGFEQALRKFYDFHGEFANHPDIARTLSYIGTVYDKLAKVAAKKSGYQLSDLQLEHDEIILNVNDIIPLTADNNHNSSFRSFQVNQQFDLDVTKLIGNNDVESLSEEGLKHHQLSIQMYLDILGQRPTNAGFAHSLFNRAKSFALLSDYSEAEKDLLDCLSIYEELSTSAIAYKAKAGEVSINLARLYFCRENDYNKFVEFLNRAMLAYSDLSVYEMSLMNSKKQTKHHDSPEELTNVAISDLNPHPLIAEALITAADILYKKKAGLDFEKVVCLLEGAKAKYEEIFQDFQHPRKKLIQKKIKQVQNDHS